MGRDDPLAVAENEVFAQDAQLEEEPRRGDGGGSGAVDDHAQRRRLLAGDAGGVHQGYRCDDGRAVLVVVHDRNVEFTAQPGLDFETLRRLDVLEVDTPESRGDVAYRADKIVGVGGVDLDVEGVEPREGLEEHRLALHDGLRGRSPDVAQPQYGRSVRDDGHQIAASRVAVDVVGLGCDGAARGGHAG